MNRNYQVQPILKAASLLLISPVIFFTQVYSQDTVSISHKLPEFSISEKLDRMFSEINTQKIDGSILESNSTSNLSTLLSKNSGVTVKSYGVTGLSSVSMRGGNSYHTAVLWNGFNLQDPLNGGYNFSSSSANIIDDVTVQFGGGSAAYGSGAIGGTIHLNNKPIFDRKLFGAVEYKAGSFGLNALNAQVGYGENKISTRVRLFKHNTNNNFEFKNTSKIGQPIEEYSNAKVEHYGVLHELYYKFKENNVISSQFWYQHNSREIPPNITSTLIEDVENNQTDQWYRWALNWNKTGDKINYEVRTGFFSSESNYINSAIDLISFHNSFKNTSEALATINIFKTQKITFGLNNNYTVGTSENFVNTPSLNTTAFYISHSIKLLKKITINSSIREEYYTNELKPTTYSINGKYNFYKSYFLTASFSKNYRTPTFNDLFWSGGFAKGNLNLEDEYGYSKDIGLELRHFTNKTNIKSSVSFYHNIINNQIQWFSEGQTWTPKNIKLVETKGVEYLLTSNYKLSKNTRLIFNLSYSYTDAQTKEKDSSESDDILNKQLIYIPYYQANSSIGFGYKNFDFNTNVQYVGYQFTRADNIDWIESYILNDISIEYKLKVKKNALVFSGQINNIFDVNYEARQWYPMPGINYTVGIKAIIY